MELTIGEYIALWQILPATSILHEHIKDIRPEISASAEVIASFQKKGYTELDIREMLKERAELIDEYNSPYRRFPTNLQEWLELMDNYTIAEERAAERKQRLKQQSSQTPGETDA